MKVAILVSAKLDERARGVAAGGEYPRRDYFELADALNAEILNCERVVMRLWRGKSKTALGPAMAQAWHAFRRRAEYDCILTDSEHVGIPLALLFKLTGADKRHVMVGHRLSPNKKAFFFRGLRVHSHIDAIVCYGSRQRDLAISRLKLPAEKVKLVFHPADHHFWRPLPVESERLICSAGLEFRDYPTLVSAINGVDVQLTIAASSPWSRRPNETSGHDLPPNVTTRSLSYPDLRQLYARSQFVVIPLHETEFQAGSLVMYEAMAMGKAVIASQTRGQGDVLEHGTTGLFVAPGDSGELKDAICSLLANPEEAREMGRNARAVVEAGLNLDFYVRQVAEIVNQTARSAVLDSRRLGTPASGAGVERA